MGRKRVAKGRQEVREGEEKRRCNVYTKSIVRRIVRCKLDVSRVDSATMEEYTSIYRAAVKRCIQLLHRVVGDAYGLHPPKGSKLRSIVHNGSYDVLRSEYPSLPAMMLCGAMKDATHAFKSTLSLLRKGNYRAKFPSEIKISVALTQSAFRLDPNANCVRITRFTDGNRRAIPFRTHCGKGPKALLLNAINRRDGCKLGEARLVKARHDWFLDVVVQQEAPPTTSAGSVHWRERTFVGVDLGLNSIATPVALQPDGVFYPPMTVPGGTLKNQLRKLRRRRAAADSRRDVEAMRAIETQRRNTIRYWCHVTSSRVVEYAKRFKNPVIVLENLETYKVEASQHSAQTNYLLSSWGRALIKGFITYKARLCGIQVVSVDAYGSTRYCNRCGAWMQFEAGSDRRVLRCPRCRYRVGRDANAAMNLAVRGRYIGAAGLLLFLMGCGNGLTQLPWISEYLKRAVTRALNRQVLPRQRRQRV